MDKSKETKNYKFALARVTTEQFAIIESNLLEKAEIRIQSNIRFGADYEKKLIAVFSSFFFETNEKQFLIVEGGCHFAIEPNTWNKMFGKEKFELIVPKEFIQHLTVITVGTTRGILHAKTENTDFNKYHLPTINVAQLVNTDSKFQFDQKK
ncbi:MAG: hypothetical protein ISS19_04535 [Bacteroidales bacterium]|nr:hypothetical protein [Bacteroidales bacterium]